MTENSAKNFVNYFNSKVAPHAQTVEQKRKKYLLAFIAACIFAVVVLPIFGMVLTPVFTKQTTVGLVGFAALIFAFVGTPYMFIKNIYGVYAKKQILPPLLGFWGNFEYFEPENKFSMAYKLINAVKNKIGLQGLVSDFIKDKSTNISVNPHVLARLIEFDGIDYDDKITGKFNEMNIELCELKTFKVSHDKEGKESHYPTFRGVVFSAAMNKKFKGLTVISNESESKNRMANHHRINFASGKASDQLSTLLAIGAHLAEAASNPEEFQEKAKQAEKQNKENLPTVLRNLKIDDVNLEDPQFRNRFKVYSSDQIEARYILTTAFMERFMKMAESFNYKVKAVFVDENIYVLVKDRKNWFELPFFRSCTDLNNYNEFLNDFSRFLAIAQTLKLNQNIGL